MPEKDHVTGIEGLPDVVGPPYYPPSETTTLPPWDRFQRGVLPTGDPDATSKDYFVETDSPYVWDVEKRTAEFFPGELEDEQGGS